MADDKIATVEKPQALAPAPKGMEDFIIQERPEGKDTGTLGNEGIGRDDVEMPRIDIAQKMSPQIDPTNAAKFIEGLAFTDMFHSTKKTVIGKGPLHFVILRRDDPRWIEWNPREQGGGIRDKNVQKGDPRTKFGPNGEKPIATEYHDFIALDLTRFDPKDPMDSIVALSLKSSGIRAAKQLNLLIEMRGKKLICKGVYTVTTGHETDKKTQGVYAIYKFAQAGWLKPDSPIEKMAIELFETWKDREVTFEREPGDEDATAFDPATIERQTDM